jgi:hypothetical protein
MRPFITACCVAIILAVTSSVILIKAVQEPVAEAFSTSAVRL